LPGAVHLKRSLGKQIQRKNAKNKKYTSELSEVMFKRSDTVRMAFIAGHPDFVRKRTDSYHRDTA
jgi:hypothetical protein